MRIFAFNPWVVLRLPLWCGHSRPRTAYGKLALAGNLRSLLVALAVLAALVPLAASQRSAAAGRAAASGHVATPHSNSLTRNFAFGRSAHLSSRSRRNVSPYSSLPFPFFADAFDSGDIYSTGYPVASDPPAFLLQAMQNMAGSAAGAMGPSAPSYESHQSRSNEPLVIELQGGRYVRVRGTASNGEVLPMPSPPGNLRVTQNSTNAQALAIAGESSSHDLPAAVLIFRDGHTEEVSDYTIAGGALYARGDFYTDGYWNKKIDLAALNVPQTVQANANRSVKFVLPSSPNQVITRP